MKKKIYLVIDNQIKQMIRELEHRMSSLETLDCLAFLSGNGSKNRGFRDVWKKMLFAMFHDAITGTHVDAAYAELMEVLFRAKQEMMELTGEILAILQAAEETSRVVFNTTGFTRDAVAEIPLPAGKRVKGLFTPSGQAFLLEEKLQGDVPCAKVLLSTMKPYEQRKIFIEYDDREPELKTEEEPGQPVLFSGTVLNDTQRDHTEALVNTNAVEVPVQMGSKKSRTKLLDGSLRLSIPFIRENWSWSMTKAPHGPHWRMIGNKFRFPAGPSWKKWKNKNFSSALLIL